MGNAVDAMRWKCVTTLRKFHGDVTAYRKQYGRRLGEFLFYQDHEPYEERVIEGNVLLREGILELWNLLTGQGSPTNYGNANAYIGVGNSSTAEADTDTGLLGASKDYQPMEATYPIIGALADKKTTWRSVWGAAEGNFAWEEWTVCNSNSDSGDNLNRKTDSLGTKSSGSWQLTVEISLA